MAKKKNETKKTKTGAEIWYRIIGIVVAICLVGGLLITVFVNTGLLDNIMLHTRKAVKSEHYTINNAQFMYMVYSVYNNYYQTYASYYGTQYLSYFGIDRSLPLADQKTGNTTWLDICVNDATASATQMLALCEAARAEGMTLTAENREIVNNAVSAIEGMAKEYNYSFKNYVANLYGSKGISKKDIREITELQMLASQYSNEAYDKFTYTDEDYNKYFDENKSEFLKADYYTYQIKADYATGADDAVKNEAISAAKLKAEELYNKISDGMDFVQVIKEYEQSIAQAAIDELNNSEDATDEQKADAKKALDEITDESIKEKISVTGHTDEGKELDKWLFGETPAADGASKMIDGEEAFDIYQVTKSAYRDEYKTVKMSRITLSLDDFDTPEKVVEYAEKIVADFNSASDKSAETFEALKDKYTTDTIKNIGLNASTENNTKFTDKKYDEVNEWLYSGDRTHGEVKYFVIGGEDVEIYYFDEYGKPVWEAMTDAALRKADLDKLVEELIAKYPVTVNQKAISKIK